MSNFIRKHSAEVVVFLMVLTILVTVFAPDIRGFAIAIFGEQGSVDPLS
ncbi:hypothetical protein [Ascidiaceihabitans sp.]